MNFKIDVNDMKQNVEVFIKGEIDAYTAPELKETLEQVAGRQQVSILVDLSDVSYMDSTGLGLFVGIFKQVRANNGKFKLVGLSARLKRLFDITGLTEIIDITSDTKGGIL
ncbi:anti-sigma factor antagonist [Bacillus massiliigorillae]|uniref:anti-sigma factor antagonist n=1 Tax=Bacillus massiliigorillae TaxID=1243664 RepID=UPI00039DA664|nr:anti-sigma factor antagonist [Bacillus massiliigorillae]